MTSEGPTATCLPDEPVPKGAQSLFATRIITARVELESPRHGITHTGMFGRFDRVPASEAGRCYRSVRSGAVLPLRRCSDAAHSLVSRMPYARFY